MKNLSTDNTLITIYYITMKERNLKLIWDFKGPGAERTAEHHALHLKEFIESNDISINITGFKSLNEDHSIAFMVVKESEMPPVRDALKPHRGQLYTNEV